MTVPSPVVVIKIGGSLLSLTDLPVRLQTLLAKPRDIRPLLIAGGGRIVDEIREWDRRFSLGEDTCHELAMESLNFTAALMARLIPSARPVETQAAAQTCWSRQEIPVLRQLQTHCGHLPRTWDVTSDSVAAGVARHWPANELWLLKSTDLPAGMTLADASRQGLVDRYFPALHAEHFQLKWCNLRAATPELIPWQPVLR